MIRAAFVQRQDVIDFFGLRDQTRIETDRTERVRRKLAVSNALPLAATRTVLLALLIGSHPRKTLGAVGGPAGYPSTCAVPEACVLLRAEGAESISD